MDEAAQLTSPRTQALRLVARELCDQPEICHACLDRADMLITTYETARKAIDGAEMQAPGQEK